MALAGPGLLYEQQVTEDKVVALHQLCAKCSQLQRESRLLQRLVRGTAIRLYKTENFNHISVKDLKHGYLNGCHLCALLWLRAGGHLLDPGRPNSGQDGLTIKLKAKNYQLEYEMTFQSSKMQKLWWKLVPPFMGELGVINLAISEAQDHELQQGVSVVSKWSELFIYSSSNPTLNQTTLKQDPEPVSSKHELKLSTIQSWYRECSTSHSKCRAFSRMVAPIDQLPSRLLDLDGGSVKLVCDLANLLQPQYTTLSHMWGPDPSVCPQLTKARLQEFTVAIALADLPTKYREAIRISRALGFRYMWIDSLCIIQDSPDDWEKEALKMATVYGRTACNISYVYPPSNKPNKQHLRDPRVELPCQIFPAKSGDETNDDTLGGKKLVVQDNVGFATRFWAPNTYKDAWPLLSRAWVFQERLLCPRNIYYGQNRLMWECCEGLQDEFCGALRESPRSKAQFHVVFSGIQKHKDGHVFKTFNGQWHLLIQEYRLLNLTYEKDRMIAFAGIVKAIQSQTKFTYLAGIWKEAAGFDLLWAIFHSSSMTDFGKKRSETQKKAPTWSWFSVPPGAGSGSIDTVDFNICSQMYARSMWTIYEASILSFHHPKQSAGLDALLHDFGGLRITLRARKIPCTLEWDDDTLRLLPNGQYAVASSYRFSPKNGMKYAHDDVGLNRGSKVPTGTFMILTMLEAWMTLGASEHRYDIPKLSGDLGLSVSKTHWQYAGLVVVAAGKGQDGRDFWKRVGVFIFDDFRDGVESFVTPFQLDKVEEDIVLI